MPSRPSRLIPLALIGSLALAECDVLFGLGEVGAIRAQSQGSMNLRLRRGSEGMELVIEGVGDQPVLQQRLNGQVWEGSLRTQGAPGVRNGQVRLTDPVSGIQSATLAGSGSSYALKVTPSPGRPLQDPVVSANGRDLILKFPGLVAAPTLQTGRLNLNTPGRVLQTQYAPPLRPRAVAPSLGDMAVGTMVLQNSSFVNVGGPPVTLTLNNAPAKDALMALARLGGYGFVFVGKPGGGTSDSRSVGVVSAEVSNPPVSIAFQNESYARALNGVLLASGLQGKLDGRTLIVGSKVSDKTFGPQMSKVYRLNQSSAVSAAKYLGSLGASIQEPVPLKTTSVLEEASGDVVNSMANASEQIEIRSYSSGQGPLVGLIGTTDSRLQTITLIGDSRLVKVAEGYLRQIDLRQRQVALSVRILDVSLDNDATISNSFAFRYGNNFILSDRGELVGAFGNLLPPNNSNFDAIAGGAESGKFQREVVSGRDAQIADRLIPPSPTPSRINPGNVFPKDNLLNLIRSIIVSSSTKTLASPTLILSENPVEISGGADVATSVGDSALQTATIGRSKANESFVTVGTQETVNYSVSAGQNGAPNSCQPILGTAGLTFGARVSKIDDNGFVSFSLSPTIAAVTGTQNVEGCGPRSILSVRRLDTGSLRVRDGQTLVLTGVISDRDAQQVRKWPILGDLPLIGQFFRESAGDRAKRELVVLVTPKIINDEQGGKYGYGYRPSLPAARQLMSVDRF